MINKFFTNPGRFIKTFFAIIAIVFFTWGGIGIQNVFAQTNKGKEFYANLKTYIPSSSMNILDTLTQYSFDKEASISVSQTDSKSALIKISLIPTANNRFPIDTNKDGILNKGDTLAGFWDALLGDDDLTDDGSITTDDGVFLEIKDSTTGDLVPYTIGGIKSIKSTHGNNISSSFWFNNPKFFETVDDVSKTIEYSTTIVVSGLKPGTKYTGQIFLEEDGAPLVEYKHNQIVSFETKPENSTITINPNQGPNNNSQAATRTDFDVCTAAAESGDGTLDNFYCQIIKVVVEIITFIPNLVAAMTGTLADMIMNISIGHGIYQFLQDSMFTGWKIVRDISNLLIIFSLFVAAFSLILGWGNEDGPEMVRKNIGDPKKIVTRAIIVAIFINFSFFFCRVLIDAGNISGRFIYNQIGVSGSVGGGSSTVNLFKDDDNEVKSISIAMLSQIQPQQLLINDGDQAKSMGMSLTHAYLATGFLVLIFDIILIYIFLIMLFLFMGRIILLALSTILSPIAFASSIIPGLSKQKYIGFEDWLKNIVGNAFVGTVFFFFIYLSVLFSNIDISGLGNLPSGTNSFIGLIVGMLFKAALIFGVLFYGKKIAVEMAGVVGEMAVSVAGKIGGAATGAVVGGGALLARQTLGAAGARMADSSDLEARIAKGGISGWAAQRQMNFGKKLASSDYDVRNIKFGGKTLNERTAEGGYDMNSTMKSTGKGFYGDVEKAKQDAEEAAARAKLRQFSREKLAQDQAKRELEIHNKTMGNHDVEKEISELKKEAEKAEKDFNDTAIGKQVISLENDKKSYIEETKAEFDDLEAEVKNTNSSINELTKTMSKTDQKNVKNIMKDYVKKHKELKEVEEQLLANPGDPALTQRKNTLDSELDNHKTTLNTLDADLGNKVAVHAEAKNDSRYDQIKEERTKRQDAINNLKRGSEYRLERRKVESKKSEHRKHEFDWKHSNNALVKAEADLITAEAALAAAEAAYQADRNNVQKQQAFSAAQATQVAAKEAQKKANDYEKLKQKGKDLEKTHKDTSKAVEKREEKLRQDHLTRYQDSFGFNMLHNDAQQIAGDTIRRLNNPDKK